MLEFCRIPNIKTLLRRLTPQRVFAQPSLRAWALNRLGPGLREMVQWNDRSFLLPAAMVFCLLAAILTSGQLIALGGALAAVLNPSDDPYAGGFGAGVGDLVLWWLSCALLILACALYLETGGACSSSAGRFRTGVKKLLLHWLAVPLVLAPILAVGVNGWDPSVVLSLALTGPLIWSATTLPRRRAVACIASLVAIICADAHQQLVVGAILTLVWFFCFGAHPGIGTKVRRWTAAAAATVAVTAVAIGPIFANGLLAIRPAEQAWDWHALLLAVWWVLPGLLVLGACALRTRKRKPWKPAISGPLWFQVAARAAGRWVARDDSQILILAAAFCILVYDRMAHTVALSTLCLLAAGGLAAASLWLTPTFRLLRRAAPYAALVCLLVSLAHIFPKAVPGPKIASAKPGDSRSGSFPAFYERWLAARGETPDAHGPIILVAVAGGGVRAAAHASVALSFADDMFRNKFGDRTLVVSAVSGGALGVATWLGRRTDGLPPADPALIRSGGISPMALQLSRFYKTDFVSPVVNRLLLHDFPLALVPGVQRSDRDRILAASWADTWDALLRSTGTAVPANSIFRRTIASLASDPRMPLVAFNATSAADGRHAVYASAPAAFPGTWLLDPGTPVMDAVADSARFAVVSPIGHTCAVREPVVPLYADDNGVRCSEGFVPISVADGGYVDNSGLVSIEAILDELVRLDPELRDVYVVLIRSNPEIGLHQREGTRYHNGRLLPELLAPAFVQEAARGARADAFAERIARRLPAQHMMTWDISREHFAEVISKGPPPRRWNLDLLDQYFAQAEYERQLSLPPLGWTLDPDSYARLHSDALSVRQIPIFSDCNRMTEEFRVLCRVLPDARSPAAVGAAQGADT